MIKRVRIQTISTLLIIFVSGIIWGGNVQAREANSPPRIWLDSATLAALRLKVSNNTPQWQTFKAYLDAHVTESNPEGYQFLDWYGWTMTYALGYQVTKVSDPTRANIYAAQALKYAKAISRDRYTIGDALGGDTAIQIDSGFTARSAGLGLAVAYDWLYDYSGFDDSTKAEFNNRLNTWITWYDSNGYDRVSVGTNYYMGYFIMKAFAGYALDNATHTANANAMWDTSISPLFNTGGLAGGDWFVSDWNYGKGVAQKLAGYVWARRSATGIDTRNDFLWGKSHLDYQIYALHPTNNSVFVDGRWSGDFAGIVSDGDMIYFAGLFKGHAEGPYYQWYINHLVGLSATYGGAKPWEYFLFFDPADPQTDYRLTKPLQHKVAGSYSGYIGMRSSWDSTATWAGFRAGGPPEGVGEGDQGGQGHFEIYKNDWLAVNAGMWSNDIPRTFYERESGYRNTLFLIDPNFGSGGQCMTYSEPGNPNRSQGGFWGGLAEVSYSKYDTAAKYVYIDADLRGAYKANTGCYPATYYHRQFFYLRPDYFLVLDRVTTALANYGKKFYLHVPAAPTVNGRTASSTYRAGKIQFASLSPTNVSLTTTAINASYPAYLTRISVAAADSNASEIFLNAIRATTSSDSATFTPTKVTETSNKMVGAKIVGAGTITM